MRSKLLQQEDAVPVNSSCSKDADCFAAVKKWLVACNAYSRAATSNREPKAVRRISEHYPQLHLFYCTGVHREKVIHYQSAISTHGMDGASGKRLKAHDDDE
jgi:hypothetical protein